MLEQVFNQADASQRAAAIHDLFTEDITFTDADRTVVGRERLVEAVSGLLAEGPPDFRFVHNGPFRGVHDMGMRAWSLGPLGGSPVAGGLDVVTVVDGRIAQLWTVLDA